MTKRVAARHSDNTNTPTDGTVQPEQKLNPAGTEIIPAQTGNRQIDHQTAAAQARQAFKTPHDMTYKTDGPAQSLVGKEHTTSNGTPILQTNDGQLYKGTLNERGNITQWQPIKNDGTEAGKPIQVTAERTGNPPAGMSPERYLSASTRPTENNYKSPEPTKAEPRSEGPKVEHSASAPKADAPHSMKEFYESQKQNFESQKHYLERAAQSLGIPAKVQEPSESKTTKVEHISVTPTRPEMERTSVPQNIYAQRIDRTISAQPNTVEYGREFINSRDSRQLFKPSLEGSIQKPIEGLQIKPEPLSQLRPEILRSLHDGKAGLVSPLQGLSEPFTFTPKNPVKRTDIIDQLGDIGKGKNPFSIVSLIPAILAIGKRPEVREPNSKLEPSKAIDSAIKGRIEPTLKANLDKFQQAQKDKLVDIATKVKDNKADNLPVADDKIAKRIKQLEPKQIDLLVSWGQGKSPIKFEDLRQDFQTKLSSIFETIVKATQLVSTDKNTNVDVRGDKSNTPLKPPDSIVKAGDKLGSEKAALADKTLLSEKTRSAESDKAADGKTKPIDDSKTRPIAKAEPIQQDKTIPIKGVEPSAESDVTVVQTDSQTFYFEADDYTQPAKEAANGTLNSNDATPRRKNRKTKPMQEQREIVNQIGEHNKLPGPRTTLLSNTARRHEMGSLASGQYLVSLETNFQGSWLKVLECTAHDDDVLFITYKLNGSASKQSIGVPSKVAELVKHNFFSHWQERIDEFLGVSK